MPTSMEDYLFDLRGYLVLEGAVSPDQVARLNAAIDAIPPLGNGDWFGNVEGHSYHGEFDGRNLQNIVEGGAAFEEMIDHPAWLDHVCRYVGPDGLFIDECFVTLRGPGEFINIHSGGDSRRIRTQFRFHNGEFRCGMINILVALTEIGEGDGPTVVIPGSHKSNLPHPAFDKGYMNMLGDPPEREVGVVPVHLKPGDALLFVDALWWRQPNQPRHSTHADLPIRPALGSDEARIPLFRRVAQPPYARATEDPPTNPTPSSA